MRHWGNRSEEDMKQMRLRKLALYFNKEEKDFVDIVNEFPDLRFRDILLKLKERGTFDFDPSDREALKKMRCKFRK